VSALSIRGGASDLDVRADGRITREGEIDAPTLDATGCTLAAGFVDVQLNGGFGVDVTAEPERVPELAARLPETGVTGFCPTVVTAPAEIRDHALRTLSDPPGREPASARDLGVHLEGPFLNPVRKGAHPERHLRTPSVDEALGWCDATRRLAMVTLAPELDGALDVVRALTERKVVVCAGHTAATADELLAGVDAGITGATHLYNAMGPFGSRDPGTVGALLANRDVICGLIADGIHADPLMVAVAWRALGVRQIALVTDAIAALGLGPGEYGIGRIRIVVDDVSARTPDGVLAGSILRMDQAVRNLVAFSGCSLADAASAASRTPARLLRRPHLGRLTNGGLGDVVLLDEAGNVRATVIGGHVAHDPDGRFSRSRARTSRRAGR
jgi:N-acetylglucosamine-6-phosphate deacetylase